MSNKYSRNFGCAFLMVAMLCFCRLLLAQQSGEAKIRLNQIGFYPKAPKTAILISSGDSIFYIQTIEKKTVFTGKLKRSVKPDFAGITSNRHVQTFCAGNWLFLSLQNKK